MLTSDAYESDISIIDGAISVAIAHVMSIVSETVDDDELGRMMTFMDDAHYPYEHFTDQPDSDQKIRECYRLAIGDHVASMFSFAASIIRSHVFDYEARYE